MLQPEEEDIADVFSSPTSGFQTPPLKASLIPPSIIIPSFKARRTDTLHLHSPSSPNLFEKMGPLASSSGTTLTRSATLPRVATAQAFQGRPRINSGLKGLNFDVERLGNLRRWILALVLVDFDLDLGPVVRGVYPPLNLSSDQCENIAFSSFPDSFQFEQGSQSHSFRIRNDTSIDLLPGVKRPPPADGSIYGFAYFTQQKDATSKRGYQQRSLVLLTHLQYPALFSALISVLGPSFHAHGLPLLEKACHNIAGWSDPIPGITFELGFIGSVLDVELPPSIDEQQLTETSSFGEKYNPNIHILATAPQVPPILSILEAVLPNLWSIWECLVLCEPILVFGPSPAITSQVIWFLRDLLRPIPLVNDIRPYFTIHDKDHSQLVNERVPKSGLIMGVTNPFFERSCRHWPHVMSLGAPRLTNGNVDSKGGTVGPPPGWKTKTHKRYISKDRPLLKKFENACKADQKTQIDMSLVLRRHFCARTTALLVPVNRYVNTLIPPPSQYSLPTSASSNPHDPLRLKPFNQARFFESLKADGSPLPFKVGKKKEFYERWLRTPSFGAWLARQEEIVNEVLRKKLEKMS